MALSGQQEGGYSPERQVTAPKGRRADRGGVYQCLWGKIQLVPLPTGYFCDNRSMGAGTRP